jgi:hypothetical protein
MGSAICCHIRCAANLQDLIQVFDGVFCRHPATVNFSTGQRHEPVRVEIVSGSYFPVLVVRDALTMIVAGAMVAILAAWALRRLVEAQLFGVRAFDVPTIVLATSVLALVALAAAMIPAWGASVSPAEALRLG